MNSILVLSTLIFTSLVEAVTDVPVIDEVMASLPWEDTERRGEKWRRPGKSIKRNESSSVCCLGAKDSMEARK